MVTIDVKVAEPSLVGGRWLHWISSFFCPVIEDSLSSHRDLYPAPEYLKVVLTHLIAYMHKNLYHRKKRRLHFIFPYDCSFSRFDYNIRVLASSHIS
jgi:hypothetical protein